MKRFILLLSFFACSFLIVGANPVTKTQALQEAKDFLATKGIVMQTSNEAYKAPRKMGSKDSNPYYYIYNVGDDKGFVIVSGDDRTEKILGYVDAGSFDEETAPAPLKEWLRGYEREIESLIPVQLPSTTTKRKVVEKTKRAIAPMTTSNWGHGYPYNSKTPTFSGKNSPVGCLPSVFAQFLYYYREHNVKAITNEIPTYTANGITLEAVPAGTPLDWDNMLDDYPYNSGYTTEQMDAVANLELYSGMATSTIYYASTALTSTANIHPALVNYFGFDDAIAFIDREYYSVDDWENIIYNELANRRLVLYNAFSTSAGHTLLVDGYDPDGLFHINWGWGKSNGYFRLSVLNRYQPGTNTSVAVSSTYTDRQSALLYAVPASLGCANTGNNHLNGKIVNASSSSISCKFHNQSGMEGYYQYGIGYVNEDGEVVLVKKFNNSFAYLDNTYAASRIFMLSSNDFVNAGVEYGTYELVPIYNYLFDQGWKVCQHESANYAVANYSESGYSCSLHSNLSSISVTDIQFNGYGLKESDQCLSVTIKNNSNEHGYSGKIYMFASTTTTVDDYEQWVTINMDKGETITVNLPFMPSTTGTYNIWITTDDYGDNIIGYTTVNIETTSPSALTVKNASFALNKNYAKTVNSIDYIWGNSIDILLSNIKNPNNTPLPTRFTVWLREYKTMSSSWDQSHYNTYGDNSIYYFIDTVVPANCEDFQLPILFENLKFNTKYDVFVTYSGGTVKTSNKMALLPALTTWKADGTSISVEPQENVEIGDDVLAVDITNATAITNVTANANPNVLYYLGAGQEVPEGLADANVVKGGVADNIALRDSCDFFVPKTFTAKNISFTTVPSVGAESGSNVGWNTIVLPFDVTSVKNMTDDKEIDWFHPGETIGKDFWVRGFERLDKDGDIIFVDNVDQMYAYEPYLYNVPGEYWGKKRNLCGKQLTFFGEDATIYKDVKKAGVHSSAYNLTGTTVGKTVSDAWFINGTGDAFIYAESQSVPAFHAYFEDTNNVFASFVSPNEKPVLRIKFYEGSDNATGITSVSASTTSVDVFNLQGVKVATLPSIHAIHLTQLPNGVYVVNGKKVIK